MAVTHQPIFVQTLQPYSAQILPADASNKKTLVTGGANGSKVEALFATSTDGTSRDLQFILTVGAVDYILDTISCPTNSGFTNNVPSLNILGSTTRFLWAAYDAAGNRYLYIPNGAVLSVKCLTTVTTAKQINIVASGGDF